MEEEHIRNLIENTRRMQLLGQQIADLEYQINVIRKEMIALQADNYYLAAQWQQTQGLIPVGIG